MQSPIEDHIRADDDPRGWLLAIRGRPLTVESLLTSAARMREEFSWYGKPLTAISAEVTGPNLDVHEVLAGKRLRTRRTYAMAPAADLADAGFPILATFAAPHISIVVPRYDERSVRSLLAALGPEYPNPFYERNPL